jgi:hypothetical protein
VWELSKLHNPRHLSPNKERTGAAVPHDTEVHITSAKEPSLQPRGPYLATERLKEQLDIRLRDLGHTTICERQGNGAFTYNLRKSIYLGEIKLPIIEVLVI